MMEFFGYWRSSSAWRCRIAFNLKGVSPKEVYVHLQKDGGQQRAADYLKTNPQGLVPAVRVDGEVLTQSLAIIEWLDETIPESPLLPGDVWQRARIRSFALAIACEIHPLQNLRVQKFLRDELSIDPSGVDRWLQRWLGSGLRACEALLTEHSSQRFAFGDSPSLADVCLAPQLYSAARFGVSLESMPRLQALGRCYDDHPAFIAAHANNQPDAEM